MLLFMATLEILVKGTTSTGIELQESFAEASSVKAGASSSETEKPRCRWTFLTSKSNDLTMEIFSMKRRPKSVAFVKCLNIRDSDKN